ncbi:MAG: hypothetical protein IJ650_01225 [Paludibacteraceae bacterium]|nr:hypothetical protein [Paludibacteraceae bacterium]
MHFPLKTILPASLAVLALFSACSKDAGQTETMFLASDRPHVFAYTFTEDKTPLLTDTLLRGTQVQVYTSDKQKYEKQKYFRLKTKSEALYVKEANLVMESRNSVLEDSVFVRTPASVIDDTLSSHVCALAEKGKSYPVVGYDILSENGLVRRYLVACGKDTGWLYSKYTVFTAEEAASNYMPQLYDSIHSRVRNTFGGGEALGCDYYPVDKPRFADNPMPEQVYSLYLNISPAVVGKIDSFIDLAKHTRINAFVLDMKDNECPAFKAEAMERYSPTNFKWGGKNKEQMYHYAVRRLHEEGFYVIGRITCFKDSYFVRDNPDCAITDRSTGEPFFHNKAYWPSAYDRRVWQFNVELAKECVRKFGLNEINFDYVRFPDKMQSVENQINYHNRYNETKVQAIQRFVQYACDEIHPLGAYVSIDVFGETTNKGYTTPYGQYWPALSNVADVMCGMPYPDHFAQGYGGIRNPWNNPYKTLHVWGKNAQARQAECPTPAKVRTWVQAYHVMRYVDPNGIDYNGYNISQEIRGLYDAGCQDGYITWLSNSSLDKYREKRSAFEVDYLADYLQRQATMQDTILNIQEKTVSLPL